MAGNNAVLTVTRGTDALSDIFETAGNILSESIIWLGNDIAIISTLGRWLAGIISASTDVIATIVKAVGSIVGGLLGGFYEFFSGLKTRDSSRLGMGLKYILFGIAGGLLVTAGKAVALIQICFSVGRPRPLTRFEKKILRQVFETSLATYNVRVVDGWAGLFNLNQRTFALGNTIYMKGVNSKTQPGLFIHECVHIWHNQHLGSRYAAEALADQWLGAGYNWQSEMAKGKTWGDFGLEAQSSFIEFLFTKKVLAKETNYDLKLLNPGTRKTENATKKTDHHKNGAVYNDHNLLRTANEAMSILRNQKSRRLSGSLVTRSN